MLETQRSPAIIGCMEAIDMLHRDDYVKMVLNRIIEIRIFLHLQRKENLVGFETWVVENVIKFTLL